MMTKPKPALRVTKDYSLFEYHPHNRDVSRTKILEQSMAAYGFDDGLPIRCIRNGQGKLRITHGHHRFDVACSMGLPIWYIVASRHIPLFESEASAHSWSVRDFTVARAKAGESPAEEVLIFHERTGIPLNVAISLVGGEGAGSHNKMPQMKNGNFQVGDMHHANAVAEVVQHCKDCEISFATNSRFVGALSKCLFVPEFDAELFMHKVSTHRELMEPRRGLDDYLDLIELVYNRHGQYKMPLAFRAREVSTQRQGSFGKSQSYE